MAVSGSLRKPGTGPPARMLSKEYSLPSSAARAREPGNCPDPGTISGSRKAERARKSFRNASDPGSGGRPPETRSTSPDQASYSSPPRNMAVLTGLR